MYYKNQNIVTFYHQKMCPQQLGINTETPSPLKPQLLLEYLSKNSLDQHFEFSDRFTPFSKEDFYIGHTSEYVNGFFKGEEPHASSHGLLGIDWSPSYVESVCYTNASFYHAIRHSIAQPEQICFSPTSGFHHATPTKGALFCAFSGEVIAALKLYQEKRLKGAFIDLDGHFGNSIGDSRAMFPVLDQAIPAGAHLNIRTTHQEYLEDFKIRLLVLEEMILKGGIDYVVFCHGADSHEDDDIGRQLNTEEWIACAEIFSHWVIKIQKKLSRPLPITLSLYGGYRDDDFTSVLSLHTASLLKILSILSNQLISFVPIVKKRS